MKISEVNQMKTELKNLLSSIKGLKNLNEGFILTYFLVLENEEARSNAEMVANTLMSQALQKGIELDITCVTEDEVEEAKKKLASAS